MTRSHVAVLTTAKDAEQVCTRMEVLRIALRSLNITGHSLYCVYVYTRSNDSSFVNDVTRAHSQAASLSVSRMIENVCR